MTNIIKYLSYASAILAALFAEIPDVTRWLLFAMGIDIVVGTLRASKFGQLSSTIAWNGMVKKVATLGILALVNIIDQITLMSVYTSFPIVVPVTAYYIYVEALSITENAIASGAHVPKILSDAISLLNPDKVKPQG